MQKAETHLGAPLISDTQCAESLVPVELVYHHTIINVSNGYFHILQNNVWMINAIILLKIRNNNKTEHLFLLFQKYCIAFGEYYLNSYAGLASEKTLCLPEQ